MQWANTGIPPPSETSMPGRRLVYIITRPEYQRNAIFANLKSSYIWNGDWGELVSGSQLRYLQVDYPYLEMDQANLMELRRGIDCCECPIQRPMLAVES
jgi:hypothetical protein